MDHIIYLWLSTANKADLNNCILILSSNGLFISYDKIVKYCNTIINLKYHNNNDSNNEISYGLSEKQFQILNNNIKSLITLKNNDPTTATTVIQLPTLENSNTIKSKLDCIIILIIDNNNDINSNNNGVLSTTITTTCTDKLFFKIWRNSVIKNEILKHCRIYNIHNDLISFNKFEDFTNYKCKGYLESIKFDTSKDMGGSEFKPYLLPQGCLNHISFMGKIGIELVENMLVHSIISLKFGDESMFNQSMDGNWLPPNLKCLEFGKSYQQSVKVGHLPKTLTFLKFHPLYKGIIEVGSIPESVKTLTIKFLSRENKNMLAAYRLLASTTIVSFDEDFDQPLRAGDIPHNVTSLELSTKFKCGWSNSLPDSLTYLRFQSNIKLGQQEDNILPKNLKHLNSSGMNQSIVPGLLPESLTKFESFKFNQPLISNGLPSNLKFIRWYEFNQQLEVNTIPESVTYMFMFYYNLPIVPNALPSNLTTLDLNKFNQPLTMGMFPKSIVKLVFSEFNHPIPQGYFLDFPYLTSLSFSEFNHPISSNTLPPNLKTLKMTTFNHPLSMSSDEKECFLTSLNQLELLELSEFDQDLIAGQLPSSITSLNLGYDFSKSINDDVLPSSLTKLFILYSNYNCSISTLSLPPSLQSIYLSKYNCTFTNNLNSNFISKYIKFHFD